MTASHPDAGLRRIGVDTGGTFTDFVVLEGGQVRLHKVPSTPARPEEALLRGLRELGLGGREGLDLVHGTTVATNALLERRGARLAFITNEGFEDLIEIGRQARGSLYDLSWTPPPPLVDREWRFGVGGRIGADGAEVVPLDRDAVVALRDRLRAAEEIVVGFLHSYANPVHEQEAARALPGLSVTVSSSIAPEFREFERFSTALVNAYVRPVLAGYLERLAAGLPQAGLRVLSGAGASMTAAAARAWPVEALLSGPAAGVAAARALEIGRVLTLDVGGTSADAALIDGEIRRTREAWIGGVPVRVAMVDMATIGAGGGSLVWIDSGGALRVGPVSAGADPGPVCYGRGGTQPTLTDAHVVAGRIPPDAQLAGGLRIDAAAARAAIDPPTARAAIEVANRSLARALRAVSVRRGHDPADFVLVAFGGLGPLHAAELMLELEMPAAVVPPAAGCWAAWGAAASPILRERWRTVLGHPRPTEVLESLAREVVTELASEGLDASAACVEYRAEARYPGQSYEVEVPWRADPAALAGEFHAIHRTRYEHAMPQSPVELVHVGVRVTLAAAPVPLPVAPERRPGTVVDGPAAIVESTSTAWVPPGVRARVDERGLMWLERR